MEEGERADTFPDQVGQFGFSLGMWCICHNCCPPHAGAFTGTQPERDSLQHDEAAAVRGRELLHTRNVPHASPMVNPLLRVPTHVDLKLFS